MFQWRTSVALSFSGGNNGCGENGGSSSSVHGLQLDWTNSKWSSKRKAEELVAYEAVNSVCQINVCQAYKLRVRDNMMSPIL